MNEELKKQCTDGIRRIRQSNPCRRTGKLLAVVGPTVIARLPGAKIGERVLIGEKKVPADVHGFRSNQAVLLPASRESDFSEGMLVAGTGASYRLPWSEKYLGRVLDARCNAMDGRSLPESFGSRIALDFQAPPPMERAPVRMPLATGIRAIDGLTTLGQGQRIGLFAGPGLGKSTLLGQIARNARADCIVLALVGERGREVAEFVERDLGKTGLQRSVVVCATSDTPAAERARALPAAMAIAEGFRRRGRSVLLLVDSLTRHARALREIALASGEPPGRRGFPASVFDKLAQVVERAGNARVGSMTAIFTVLTEGEHREDPVAHEVKGLLDGHIVLSSRLARAGCFPALDMSASISRIMDQIVDANHREVARKVRMLWSAYEERRDLIAAGAYEAGSEPMTDLAIARREAIVDFIRQDPGDSIDAAETIRQLFLLIEEQVN